MEDEAEDPKVSCYITSIYCFCFNTNDNFYRFVITIFIFQLSPMYWVSKWVDYSDKYGFGYALCDESIGVVFNDLTKLLLLSDGR